jgi:sensor histidine kinase YesM
MDFRIECEPAAKKQFIPPMIILPLVENSIKHGISKLIENGEIFVKVYEKEDQLIIFVKDNGPESEETYPVDAKKSTGFGHQSIIDRLKITYQERFRFEISENEAVYCVKISIPINNR